MILFQIIVFGKNIKETTPARYFIKVTARPSFTRLRGIWRTEFIKYQNTKYVTKIQLYLSLFYLNLFEDTKYYFRKTAIKKE